MHPDRAAGSRRRRRADLRRRSRRPRPSIAAMQEPDGAVPWTVGEHTDVWNHVEAAMALLVGGQVEAAERAFELVPGHPARRRLVADEDRRRRGRGPQRRDQHVGVPRGRRLAPLAGPPRLRLRTPPLAGRAPRRSTGWSAMQLPFGGIAWSQEWADGRPGEGQPRRRCWPARRASTSRCAPGVALVGADGRAAARVGARRRPARARAARAPRPVPRQVARSRWTGTTRSSAAPSAARPATSCSRPAGTTSWCPASASAASTPTRG